MTGNYGHYLFIFTFFPLQVNLKLLAMSSFLPSSSFFCKISFFFINGFCQYTVGAAFKLFRSGMMLAINLTKWQRNPSGLWASPSPLAEGSSLFSGALSLFSASSHGNTKGNYENTHLGADLRQPYFTPAVTLGVVFPNTNQKCCGLSSVWSCSTAKREISAAWGTEEPGVNTFLCFCQKM